MIINVELEGASLMIVTEKFIKDNDHILKHISYDIDNGFEYNLYYSNFSTNAFYLTIRPTVTFDKDTAMLENVKKAYASLFKVYFKAEYIPTVKVITTVDGNQLSIHLNLGFKDFNNAVITNPFNTTPAQVQLLVLNNLANLVQDNFIAKFTQAVSDTLSDIAKSYKDEIKLNKAIEADFNTTLSKGEIMTIIKLNETEKKILACKEIPLLRRIIIIKLYKDNLHDHWSEFTPEDSITLAGSFIWEDTSQGHKYWSTIDQQIGGRQ